jgi:hypothetical protein
LRAEQIADRVKPGNEQDERDEEVQHLVLNRPLKEVQHLVLNRPLSAMRRYNT